MYQSCTRSRCPSSCFIADSDIQLSPDYVGVELGIGESLLIKAIGESTGRSLTIIKADLKREGDLGLVAMASVIFDSAQTGCGNPLFNHRTPRITKRHCSN